MTVKKLTKDTFNEARTSEKRVLIDFYADWCGPCRMVAPVIASIAESCDDYFICKVNVDDDPDLAREFGVFSIPTLVVLEDGIEVGRSTGALPKPQILALLES